MLKKAKAQNSESVIILFFIYFQELLSNEYKLR